MISGSRMFIHLSAFVDGRVLAMFNYVIDKSVGSIKSVILIMIINRYSKSLQNVNIYAWLNFSKKKYKKSEGDLLA